VDPNLPKPKKLAPLPKPDDAAAPTPRPSEPTPTSPSTGNTQKDNASALGAAVGTAVGEAVKHHREKESQKKAALEAQKKAAEAAKYSPPPANPQVKVYANGDGVAEEACKMFPDKTAVYSTSEPNTNGAGFSCAAYAAGKR
jgi:hypothetical protein